LATRARGTHNGVWPPEPLPFAERRSVVAVRDGDQPSATVAGMHGAPALTEPTKPTGRSTSGRASRRKSSTSPTGTSRAGRRETPRRRYDQPSTLERFRTPIIAVAVVAAVVAVAAFVFTSASSPAYACTAIDTVQPPVEGELGQVQPDMGNTHVNPGDKITYPLCPPASGKHVNRTGFGPLTPRVYGPDDSTVPNGWVHNLEHGGLVLLYSCDKGACDDAGIQQLQDFTAGFPASAICQIPPGAVGPVVARFEQMPTKYTALVWDRVLYMEELDPQEAYDFYLRYAEQVTDAGQWISPPEPQCNPPSPEPSASPEASPSASAATTPSAAPSAQPSPSPSAS
jgi:hypothetical protein